MSNYSIGISALEVVQQSINIVGNNIANAATEGYHKQRIDLRPSAPIQTGDIVFGSGVEVVDVVRLVDNLVDQELLRQESLLNLYDTEVSMLKMVESVLGEMSSDEGGLSVAIDNFFNSMKELSAHPDDSVYQNQVINDAEAMANQFRTIGEYMEALDGEIQLEAENTVETINIYAGQIAQLNDNIERIEVLGSMASSLRDERDQLIKKLSEIARVETIDRDYGVVDVTLGGLPLVMGSSAETMQLGYNTDGTMGITTEGASNYLTDIGGGRIGGLITLKNDLIPEIGDDLDALAAAIIEQVNKYHIQGVGPDGAFTSLTGWTMSNTDVSDFSPSVTDGSLFIRVTNTSTNVVSRHEITIDASSDTLSSVATDISAITGLTASVASSKLSILADANYTFDFLPSVLSAPTASNLNGSSPPTVGVSGIYTGTANDTFTFTAVGTGSVGNGTLQLSVTDGDGDTVATLNVGSGYAVGEKLEVGNGIEITLTTGDLVNGDTFEVDGFGDTDTSGFLLAVGLNAFFSGSSAEDISVSTQIINTPNQLATSLGADMTDNKNALRMAEIKDMAITSLDSLSCGDFYRKVVTNLGQSISTKEMRHDNIEFTVQNLLNQQSEISGVDINEEAAQLLVLEQMFQSIAKYMNTIKTTMMSLMEAV